MTGADPGADPAAGPIWQPLADPSWSGAALAALLATLEVPTCWAVSLAGFLARGGLILFLLPIVVLPTPAGVQAVISPLLVPALFGQVSLGLLALAALLVGLLAAWLVVGGLTGAWADVVVIRRAADSIDPLAGAPRSRRGTVASAFVARLLAHAPLATALAWGAIRLVQAAYAELLTPFEVVTPLVIRIVAAAPDVLALVVVTWLLGEAAGGLAVREITLGGRSTVRAVLRGWIALARRPLATLATLTGTTLLVAIAVLPGLVASATAWSRLRFLLFESGRPEEIALGLSAFVALWLGGLVLAGVATTARSAVWTAEWLRRQVASPATMSAAQGPTVGTIGVADATDRGGWPSSGASGTL